MTLREEIYHKLHLLLEDLVDVACDQIEEIEKDEEVIDRDYVIRILDKLKSEHPGQKIIVETPNGSVELKIGDTLIYEGMGGEIVIDSE